MRRQQAWMETEVGQNVLLAHFPFRLGFQLVRHPSPWGSRRPSIR